MSRTEKKLTRSTSEKVVAGVLGGLAEYFDWDISIVRIVFVLISIFSAAFPGILVYVILWAITPVDNANDYQKNN